MNFEAYFSHCFSVWVANQQSDDATKAVIHAGHVLRHNRRVTAQGNNQGNVVNNQVQAIANVPQGQVVINLAAPPAAAAPAAAAVPPAAAAQVAIAPGNAAPVPAVHNVPNNQDQQQRANRTRRSTDQRLIEGDPNKPKTRGQKRKYQEPQSSVHPRRKTRTKANYKDWTFLLNDYTYLSTRTN